MDYKPAFCALVFVKPSMQNYMPMKINVLCAVLNLFMIFSQINNHEIGVLIIGSRRRIHTLHR